MRLGDWVRSRRTRVGEVDKADRPERHEERCAVRVFVSSRSAASGMLAKPSSAWPDRPPTRCNCHTDWRAAALASLGAMPAKYLSRTIKASDGCASSPSFSHLDDRDVVRAEIRDVSEFTVRCHTNHSRADADPER